MEYISIHFMTLMVHSTSLNFFNSDENYSVRGQHEIKSKDDVGIDLIIYQ